MDNLLTEQLPGGPLAPETLQQNNPPAHEPEKIAAAPATTPTAKGVMAAISKAASSVASAVKGAGKKRGRPPTPGSPYSGYKISNRDENNHGDEEDFPPNISDGLPHVASSAAAPATPGNLLFGRSVANLVKGAAWLAKGYISIKADAADIDQSFVEKQLALGENMQAEAIVNFQESLGLVAEKYGWKMDYMPELALAESTLVIASPFVLMAANFNAEIKRKRALEKKADNISPIPGK